MFFVISPPENASIDLLRCCRFAHDTNEAAMRREQGKGARHVYWKWQGDPSKLDHVFYWCIGGNKKIMNLCRYRASKVQVATWRRSLSLAAHRDELMQAQVVWQVSKSFHMLVQPVQICIVGVI